MQQKIKPQKYTKINHNLMIRKKYLRTRHFKIYKNTSKKSIETDPKPKERYFRFNTQRNSLIFKNASKNIQFS